MLIPIVEIVILAQFLVFLPLESAVEDFELLDADADELFLLEAAPELDFEFPVAEESEELVVADESPLDFDDFSELDSVAEAPSLDEPGFWISSALTGWAALEAEFGADGIEVTPAGKVGDGIAELTPAGSVGEGTMEVAPNWFTTVGATTAERRDWTLIAGAAIF